jgi:hypothetical protein
MKDTNGEIMMIRVASRPATDGTVFAAHSWSGMKSSMIVGETALDDGVAATGALNLRAAVG